MIQLRHVHEVEVHERQRVHGQEPVALLHRLVAPVKAGVEAERLAARLDRRVERHVGVVMHRPKPRRGDGEAEHAGDVAEAFDDVEAGFRMIERQVEHRLDALVLRQDPLDEPAIIGGADCDLDLGLRVHAEHQHRGRKHHHVIDAHAVHGALDEGDLGVGLAGRHRFAETLLMGNAPEHVLIEQARRGVEEARAASRRGP